MYFWGGTENDLKNIKETHASRKKEAITEIAMFPGNVIDQKIAARKLSSSRAFQTLQIMQLKRYYLPTDWRRVHVYTPYRQLTDDNDEQDQMRCVEVASM